MKRIWMVILMTVGVAVAGADLAEAKDCTGANCVCGDRLVANWNSGNLGTVNCSTTNGLRLASGVTWTGTGTILDGAGGDCGVKFEGSNAKVIGVYVTGWYDGVCNFSGTNNTYQGAGAGSEVWIYGNSHYGVHSTKAGFKLNRAVVYANNDEGVHCASQSCTVFASYVYDNGTVQVYFLNLSGGSVTWNYIANGTTSVHLKDASSVLIAHNEIENSPVHIRRNSNSVQIEANTVDNTFIKLEGESTARPDGCWLTGNQITRNNTKINYKNPGINNNIDTSSLIGSGNDVTCSDFAGGGTNHFNANGDSVVNHNGCLTVF